MSEFFDLIHTSDKSKARAGLLKTDHGEIPTPIFMPVGTQGTVKALEQRELIELDAKIILGNTYHLYLRPGNDLIKHFGGLHKFINWDRAMLTDSGGYQVFSLKDLRKLTEEGVEFKSHIDGSKHFFSPESVIETQRILGSDIVMVLDECTPYPSEMQVAKKSMDLSLRWAKRCKEAFHSSEPLWGHRQFLFSIGQGSMYKDLRIQYLKQVTDIGFDGYAIGGLSVGEPAEMMYEMTDVVCSILPEEKPRYLMGVGTPTNLLENISLGIDMFDCVMPTRNARNGMLFTSEGTINIKNKKWEKNYSLLDPNGTSYVDQSYSKAYVRHLFKTNEILGKQIASLHNIRFYLWLMEQARIKLKEGTFSSWKNQIVKKLDIRL